MSSPLFPGQIPLPGAAPPPQQQHPAAAISQLYAASSGSVPYDANTLAYYNAYYAQYSQYLAAMSMAGTGAWPVTGAPAAPLVYPCQPLPLQHQQAWPTAAAVSEAASGAGGEDEDGDDETAVDGNSQKRNVLPVHGNEKTMNLNSLILTNIQQSNYFRNTLYSIKTFNELIDEIWENVKHCEPWERASRKVSPSNSESIYYNCLPLFQVGNQTGMCGSVRGVGAGGIISTAFCCLYKLLTLRPTRKQLMSMIKYKDAPFIRAIGLLYVRYTQPPDQLWTWFSKFLSDGEEFCPASVAGSSAGRRITIGQMCRQMLTKQDWFSALFPRIPVPIQKEIQTNLQQYDAENENNDAGYYPDEQEEEAAPDQKRYNNRREERGEEPDRRREETDRRRQQRDDRSRSRDRKRRRSPSDERRADGNSSRSRDDRSHSKHSSSSRRK